MKDPINPYRGHGRPYWFYSVPEEVRQWSKFDGCKRRAVKRMGPGALAYRHIDCDDDAEVMLVQIEGAGHTWPGSPYQFPKMFGSGSDAVDANSVMASFFGRHPKRQGCRDAVAGERCHDAVQRALEVGIPSETARYKGQPKQLVFKKVQTLLHKGFYADCPRACVEDIWQ